MRVHLIWAIIFRRDGVRFRSRTKLCFSGVWEMRDFSYFCGMNRTFTMIKPDAVANGHIGAILNDIIAGGFRIVAMKYIRLTRETAGDFYAVHRERPFYGELVEYMTSGPIVAAILEKDNAVEAFRKLIGGCPFIKMRQEMGGISVRSSLAGRTIN